MVLKSPVIVPGAQKKNNEARAGAGQRSSEGQGGLVGGRPLNAHIHDLHLTILLSRRNAVLG